jgi:hypothetical protein
LRKNSTFVTGILSLALVFGFVLTGCEDPTDGGGGGETVEYMSGTVAFTNMPNSAPYRIEIDAYYAYDGKDSYIGSGTVTLNGTTNGVTTGTWSIPRDSAFVAALESGNIEVTFYLDMQFTEEGEIMNNVGEVKKTRCSIDDLAGIDLDTVHLAFVTLSGTVNVTYNGQPAPRVRINAFEQNGGYLGSTTLTSPAAGASWSIIILPFETATNITFEIYGIDSNGSGLFAQDNVATANGVTNSDVSGISISYAYTAATTYTVTFNGNGGSTPSSQTVNAGSSITLPSTTRSGYTLNGRYTSSSGGTKVGNVGASYTPSSSVTLYAQWNQSGGGLPDAKGKLTLNGFSDFNGKYVYSALITASGKYLIGTNAEEFTNNEYVMSMVRISGGSAQVPLYTTNTSGSSVADIYVPYDGSETFQTVAVMIVNDSDGKFTAVDAAAIAANYAAMISNNPSNTSFTPSTSGGNITINRSDAKTMAEMMADMTLLTTAKYMLLLP